MSEYQYYEFRSIDRSLTPKEMEELRDISSRAEITPTSLINEYNYGNFRGDPEELMAQYFDAFLYFANWGTHRLMLRVPKNLVDLAAVAVYQVDGQLTIQTTEDHVIFDFESSLEESPDYEAGLDSLLPDLLPLRQDLLRGDYRSLYLGWLGAVQKGEVDDEDEEPSVPAGLQKLSPALKSLAGFLYIEDDLLEAAIAAGQGDARPEPTGEQLQEWLRSLPEQEKINLLLRTMQGDSAYLGAELLQRYYKTIKGPKKGTASSGRRTAGELLAAREMAEKERKRVEAEKQAQRAHELAEKNALLKKQAAAAREKSLKGQIGTEKNIWQQAEQAVNTKRPDEYQRATSLLTDLRDMAKLTGNENEFNQRIAEFQQRHLRKTSFCKMLSKLNLTK